MPIISSFFGIVIRMYLTMTNNIIRLIFMQNMAVIRRLLTLKVILSPVVFHKDRPSLLLLGQRFIVMSSWRYGILCGQMRSTSK